MRREYLKAAVKAAIRFGSVALAAGLLASCGGTKVLKPTSFDAVTPAAPQRYVLGPGDELNVKFFYNPELNEKVTIRPDGRISLPLVGEVQAAGRTPAELERTLRDGYGRELKQPDVAVIVSGFEGYQAFVDGEVTKPGPVKINGGVTALQSVAMAGGIKETGDVENVILIRRGPDGYQVVPLLLNKVIDGTDTRQDLTLQPHDVVVVPRSGVADTNLWIDQYVRKNIPIPLGFGYSFN